MQQPGHFSKRYVACIFSTKIIKLADVWLNYKKGAFTYQKNLFYLMQDLGAGLGT